jgi:hypothetical protein
MASETIGETMWDEFVAACKRVYEACPDGYAKSCAARILEGRCPRTLDGVSVQCDYILANTQSWRGDIARSVKATLRMIRSDCTPGHESLKDGSEWLVSITAVDGTLREITFTSWEGVLNMVKINGQNLTTANPEVTKPVRLITIQAR